MDKYTILTAYSQAYAEFKKNKNKQNIEIVKHWSEAYKTIIKEHSNFLKSVQELNIENIEAALSYDQEISELLQLDS